MNTKDEILLKYLFLTLLGVYDVAPHLWPEMIPGQPHSESNCWVRSLKFALCMRCTQPHSGLTLRPRFTFQHPKSFPQAPPQPQTLDRASSIPLLTGEIQVAQKAEGETDTLQ